MLYYKFHNLIERIQLNRIKVQLTKQNMNLQQQNATKQNNGNEVSSITQFIQSRTVCDPSRTHFMQRISVLWSTESGVSSADNHQCRFHQTLLHFIYENYIFLIGLFQPFFIFPFSASNRLFYGSTKSDFKYSFSIVIQIFRF